MEESGNQRPRRAHRSRRPIVTTTASTHGNAQSDGSPPHLDFVKRYAGALPETIVESDLETLNSGLVFLFALLRDARRLYDEEGDGGRAGAFTALGAMWQFIMLFKLPHAELLHTPILNLQTALAALEENNVLPIVKPVARHGRAPSSHVHATLKGHAAGTVRRLVETGLGRREAHQTVAKLLQHLSIRPERGSGSVTATTVRNWQDEVSSDVGRRGTAAMMHDSMFTLLEQQSFSAMAQDQARRYALAELAQWVQSVFLKMQDREPS
jgi:hypothetical protein